MVASVGFKCFRLQACQENGSLEVSLVFRSENKTITSWGSSVRAALLQDQTIEFDWNHIKTFEVEVDSMSFSLEYHRPGKKPKKVKLITPFVRTQFINDADGCLYLIPFLVPIYDGLFQADSG